MNYNTIKNKLCCPFDKSELSLQVISLDDETDNVVEGILTCQECKRLYPIISGIPIMVPDEFREESMEKPMLEKWKSFIDGKDVKDFRLIY
jgi:uncharacterized protein YbaR (Trm112 family)